MAEQPTHQRPTSKLVYDDWIESAGVPIHRGHFISDLRTIEVGHWDKLDANVAFLQFMGMEGVSEGRITEIPPGGSIKPLKLAVGETVYVIDGQGLATVWAGEGPKRTFEWQSHSMFHIPRYATYELSNARGDQPARLLHYNYLPMAMTVVPDPEFFYNNDYEDPDLLYGGDEDSFMSARAVLGKGAKDENAEAWGAKVDESIPAANHGGAWWIGNFFPDMASWDKLSPHRGRGAGGYSVKIRFPNTNMSASMSVFEPAKYKKAHLHGPGRVIVIPKGDGYSVLWPPNGEPAICPWGEAAVFTPPAGWFHQHFNLGTTDARYLKFGHLPQLSGAGNARDQIEYPDEDPWVRQNFEKELAAVSRKSEMPPEVYADRDYKWDYGDDND